LDNNSVLANSHYYTIIFISYNYTCTTPNLHVYMYFTPTVWNRLSVIS